MQKHHDSDPLADPLLGRLGAPGMPTPASSVPPYPVLRLDDPEVSEEALRRTAELLGRLDQIRQDRGLPAEALGHVLSLYERSLVVAARQKAFAETVVARQKAFKAFEASEAARRVASEARTGK